MGLFVDYLKTKKKQKTENPGTSNPVCKDKVKRMEEVREKLRIMEQEIEWKKTKTEVFADEKEPPTKIVQMFLADDLLND